MDIEFSEFHTKRQKEKAMAKLLELAKMQRAMTVEQFRALKAKGNKRNHIGMGIWVTKK